MSNTTHVTGSANSSLSYNLTASNISSGSHGWRYVPENNLGYGVGKIVRGAFDLLYQAWQKMWTPEPSSEALALRNQAMIYRQQLSECVKRLDSAIDTVRKNPRDPSSLKKIKLLAEHYASYLQPQEKPESQAYQQKVLQPLEEKISQLAHPHIRNALQQLLPIFFQGKTEEEKKDLITPTRQTQARQEAQSGKRALQQVEQWSASFNLTTLDGTNGFVIPGIAADGFLGTSVSTTGDLNGDGMDDLVLGDWGGSYDAGIAYVLFGQAGGWPASFNLTTLNGMNGFAIPGIATGTGVDLPVGTAGDLNGDGKDDLVLGAPNGLSDLGVAYVLFGQAGGWPASFNLTTLNGTNGFAIPGIVRFGLLGSSVSTAGDLNGDDKDDLVLCTNEYGSGPGVAYVLLGQANGWPASFNLATLNGTNGFAVPGLAENDSLGLSVSTAGDMNGDGNDDLVLGEPSVSSNAGAAYVLFGQAGGWPASFDLTTLNGTNGFAVPGIAWEGELGNSVSTAGDFNADGMDDLVLGAYSVSGIGEAYVLFGQAGGWPASFNLTSLNGTNGFAVPADIAGGGYLGRSVSTAGDINGDGKDDLVLGAPAASIGAGDAYVLFGQADGWTASFNLTTLDGTNGFAVPGIAARGQLGWSVSTAGDLNGDGLDDLVLGAPNAASYAGAAYVIFGVNTSLLTSTISSSPVSLPNSSIAPSPMPILLHALIPSPASSPSLFAPSPISIPSPIQTPSPSTLIPSPASIPLPASVTSSSPKPSPNPVHRPSSTFIPSPITAPTSIPASTSKPALIQSPLSTSTLIPSFTSPPNPTSIPIPTFSSIPTTMAPSTTSILARTSPENPNPIVSPSQSATTGPSSSINNQIIGVASGVLGAVALGGIVGAILLLWRKKRGSDKSETLPVQNNTQVQRQTVRHTEITQGDFGELEEAEIEPIDSKSDRPLYITGTYTLDGQKTTEQKPNYMGNTQTMFGV